MRRTGGGSAVASSYLRGTSRAVPALVVVPCLPRPPRRPGEESCAVGAVSAAPSLAAAVLSSVVAPVVASSALALFLAPAAVVFSVAPAAAVVAVGAHYSYSTRLDESSRVN